MDDKIASRAFPVFAIAFALYYAPAYCFTGADSTFNWPLFTYFPNLNEFRWGIVPGSDDAGPPMWWYGWMASAAIVGVIAAVISLLLPARATESLWSTLVWSVPLAAFVFLANWELVWFVDGWMPRWFE